MKRAVTLVAVIAILCIVSLMILLRQLEGLRSPPPAAPTADEPADAKPDGTEPTDWTEDDPGIGRVLFADGSPAAGANVTVVWDADAGPRTEDLRTGPRGKYRMPGEAREQGRLRTLSVRYGPLLAHGLEEFEPDSPVPPMTLPATFRLAGRVVQAGPEPTAVVGAAVRCAGVEARSGEKGAFVLADVPATALWTPGLTIEVEADGRETLVWDVPLDELPPYYGDLTFRMRRR